jgi:hypothetical protein
MKKSISKIFFAVVAMTAAASAFSGEVNDMDGTAAELLNSPDGGKNIIAFGRCGAVLMYVSATFKVEKPGSDTEIYDSAAHMYVQGLFDTVGAKTPEQKEPLRGPLMNIKNEYQKLSDTRDGRQKIRDDIHACLTFVGSANK